MVLVRPVSAELPRLSRRVDATSVQVRDLTRTISDHPPIRAALEARGFAKPMTKALTRGRLPSLQRLPLCRDIACIIGELPYLTAFGPLLARAAQRSAKNSFDSIVSRLQFKNFLSQWRTDTAYCHRCGSGPFALSQTAAAEGEDVGAACAVCSTILIAADRHGRDTRALVDFDAQVVRRRLTCLEDKLDVLSLIQRAIATHEKIVKLFLNGNPIPDAGCASIVRALRDNKSVVMVDLSSTGAGELTKPELAELVRVKGESYGIECKPSRFEEDTKLTGAPM